MKKKLNTYDWAAAFNVAQGGDYDSLPQKSNADWALSEPEQGEIPVFSRDDVTVIYAIVEGTNDEEEWLLLGKAKGLYFYLSAGCDYTGWDCRSNGRVCVARSKARIINFAITPEEKVRLGL